MNVSLRRFCESDVPLKVRWINNPENNRYLHYDLPLREEATLAWLRRVRDSESRLDMSILCDDVPVGIAGLLQIDHKNECAECYVTVGEVAYKGKGIAGLALKHLMEIAFWDLGLHRVYLFTETNNVAAVRAYEKFGFVREGCLRDEICRPDGRRTGRYVYSILKPEYEERYSGGV